MNLVDLSLFVLIDIDINDNFTFMCQVVLLNNFDFHILKTFSIKEFLDQGGSTVDHVRRYLIALTQSQTGVQIFAFPLLDTVIVHL